MNKTKTITLTVLSAVFIMIIASSAHAVFLACFNQGDFIDFCNPAITDRTAPTDSYFICMSQYIEESSCYVHAGFNACNNLPSDDNAECGGNQGTPNLDVTPPELTINNPAQDDVFTSTSVLFDYHVNERSDIYYKDLNDSRDRFVRICTDCTGNHQKMIRMDEGENNIRMQAIDVVGNAVEEDIKFFVDSKDPRISKAEPKKGFADGNFEVEYIELNPDTLVMTYGDGIAFFDHNVDLNTCTEVRSGRMGCNFNVDLNFFDGSDIDYWFTITDIAGNNATNRVQTLTVDSTDPVINGDINYTVDKRNALFKLNITELNFDKVEYLDDQDSRARWRTLCSRLTDGMCSGRASLSDGFHTIILNVTDEAGNYVSDQVSFYTDSKAPKIRSTEPRRGFADGNFRVSIDEANPVSLYLNYGNDGSGWGMEHIDLGTCHDESRGMSCDVSVNLDTYHGQEIDYWFNLTDIVGGSVDSRATTLSVDTVAPVVNDFNYTIDGRRVTFYFNVTEENFDSIDYIDNEASRPRYRPLCTRISDEGICERTQSFSSGHHDLDIMVVDDAGNAVSEHAEFDIV